MVSNGISTMSLRHLSRDLTASQPSSNGTSTVTPNGISAVTKRHLSREQRLRCRNRLALEVGFTSLGYKPCRLDIAGGAISTVMQLVCACGAHGKSSACPAVPNLKSVQGLEA